VGDVTGGGDAGFGGAGASPGGNDAGGAGLNTGGAAGACARADDDSTNNRHATRRNAKTRKLI